MRYRYEILSSYATDKRHRSVLWYVISLCRKLCRDWGLACKTDRKENPASFVLFPKTVSKWLSLLQSCFTGSFSYLLPKVNVFKSLKTWLYLLNSIVFQTANWKVVPFKPKLLNSNKEKCNLKNNFFFKSPFSTVTVIKTFWE